MNKKEKEKKILSCIYNSDEIHIEESEHPDFIIKAAKETFGVEITEFYYNETTARLINFKGYKERIMNSENSSILDKSDIGKVSKNKLYLFDKCRNEWIFLTDYIGIKYSDKLRMNEIPYYNEIEKRICSIIKHKNLKAKKYKRLDYLELIILDKEKIEMNSLKKLSTSKNILDIVIHSAFRRLYLLSGEYLCVFGIKPSENVMKYNKESKNNE